MTTVALITGGASGIGAAVARNFARTGSRVVVADTDVPAGRAVAAELDGLFVRADVSSEAANRAAVDAAVAAFGRLDVVHLNAGTGGGGGIGDDFDLNRYRRVLAVNLDGTMFGIRAAVPALAATGGGSIVVTASLAGIAPAPFDPVYSASKHAIIGLVRSLAPTLSASGITVNALCPGFVDTPMIAGLRDEIIRRDVAVAQPDEVAAAVRDLVRQGGTGQAWAVQAGAAPVPVTFPAVELGRTA